jgi:ferredoxin
MDKSCIVECPVDCIYEGVRQLYIKADECIDCGACEPVCPVDAIAYEDDLADERRIALTVNQEIFADGVMPGGARKVGPLGRDHPLIAALPPRG